jgi:hypothetical protein
MVRFRYLFVDGVQRRDVVLAADCLGEQRQIRCGKNLLLEVAPGFPQWNAQVTYFTGFVEKFSDLVEYVFQHGEPPGHR